MAYNKVWNNLENEYSEVLRDVNKSRMELNEILKDQVNGFDVEFKVGENIDFLDSYSQFLGPDYEKMKKDYKRAIDILNETYQLKFEKLKLNEPISEEEINEIFTEKEKETLTRIHNDYILAEQNRKKYQERYGINFHNFNSNC